ncbi:hypothetical protein FQN60_003136 [Etheostoma spectabile]|uniref:Uncharacterized protein n=1 Tax=Etheostoma spectabile TaxID=54343 RepID=A0A5J5CKZ6_9PERO|nr:hypothetical protein FQN60_003136 [Etheostoma spectabile]
MEHLLNDIYCFRLMDCARKELSMESGIDPGQDYYTQDYYNYDHGYDLPQYGSRRKLISPAGLYDEYGEVVVDDDGSYYYSPQESEGEVKRQFGGGRLAQHPAYLQPCPPPSHGPSKKTPAAPRTEGDKDQASEGGTTTSTKPRSSRAAARLKAVMRVSTLLSSGSKTSGQPPAIHLPWNKARVRPMEEGGGGSDRLEERKGERVERGFQIEEAWKVEHRGGRIDEAKEKGNERGGRRELETWGRSNRGDVTNSGMRNAVEVGVGIRPQHRGELPGHFARLDGSMVIDGSYFQTSVEASKPLPVKQKLSEALSLISLTRRLQGPARVGDEQWSNGKSWDREGENSREMYGSIGDMSVSASVSESAMGEERRKWERELGEENSASEVWWKGEKLFHDRDSVSKESPSEFCPSDASSLTSSFTAERDNTQSDTETEKEEGTPDRDRESESESQDEEGSESTKESGLESEDENANGRASNSYVSSNRVSSKSRRSSPNLKRESTSRQQERSRHPSNSKETDRNSRSNSQRSRYSGSTVSSSRPKTSRHSQLSREAIEEESEESGEDEEERVKSNGSQNSSSSRRASNNILPDISSGGMDTSEDLSPIIEDTEEDEKSSGHGGEGEEDEEERDLENEFD